MPSNVNYSYLSGINSFPTTKMESVNKLITENSLTRLINRLLDLDGYIITEQLAEKNSNSEIIGNGGTRLPINSDLNLKSITFRNNLFEFVIRGYYFSVNASDLITMLDNYIETQSPTTKIGLFARIFIDNTNPNYPELVGQTAYEDDLKNQEEDPNYIVRFEEGRHYGVQFFCCPLDEIPAPYHPVLSDPTTGLIDGIGSTYLYFDLMLLEYFINDETHVNGNYIPFASMNKFSTQAVNIIDGGVLTLYNNTITTNE
jgi:hypothetical protein